MNVGDNPQFDDNICPDCLGTKDETCVCDPEAPDITYKVSTLALPEFPILAEATIDNELFSSFGATKAEAEARLREKIESYWLAKSALAEDQQ